MPTLSFLPSSWITSQITSPGAGAFPVNFVLLTNLLAICSCFLAFREDAVALCCATKQHTCSHMVCLLEIARKVSYQWTWFVPRLYSSLWCWVTLAFGSQMSRQTGNGRLILCPSVSLSRGTTAMNGAGLGIDRPAELTKSDDEYDAYRKRMMLAYRFRPNPLVTSLSLTLCGYNRQCVVI